MDTLAQSYLNLSSKTSGSGGATQTYFIFHTQRKKYFHSYRLLFETLGPDTKSFFTIFGMVENTGEKRSYAYLLERISIAIQRGNAACILSTFSDLGVVFINVKFEKTCITKIAVTI